MFLKWVFLLCASLLCNAECVDNFTAYKTKYNKTYTAIEEPYRRKTFCENMIVAQKNAQLNKYATFGTNEYSDLSADEFKKYHNLSIPKKQTVMQDSYSTYTKKTIDWRKHGAVTSVKNQGQCGSCWAFSAIGNIEGQWFLANNSLISLAEQELVSCDNTDNGCDGGLMVNAFEWIINYRGGYVSSYNNYPYVSGNGNVPSCELQKLNTHVAQICNYDEIDQNENAMSNYVYENGPISVGVDATSWQTYTSGIMTNCISNKVDHGVLVIGFDDNYKIPYWIIKNSWGASWGENGYIRISKNVNNCLITTAPSSSVTCDNDSSSNDSSSDSSSDSQ